MNGAYARGVPPVLVRWIDAFADLFSELSLLKGKGPNHCSIDGFIHRSSDHSAYFFIVRQIDDLDSPCIATNFIGARRSDVSLRARAFNTDVAFFLFDSLFGVFDVLKTSFECSYKLLAFLMGEVFDRSVFERDSTDNPFGVERFYGCVRT
jgi:hypothetical protein